MSKVTFECPILQEYWDKCIANRDWNKIGNEINALLDDLEYFRIEYNSDTSAGHPVEDGDIVRYSLETRRVNDKEH